MHFATLIWLELENYLNLFSLLFPSQFDLVCDKAIYGTVSSSLLFLGSLMGNAIISTLSDKFGRRIIIFTSGFVVALFSLLSAFPNSYWLFTLFRFVVGFSLGKFVLWKNTQGFHRAAYAIHIYLKVNSHSVLREHYLSLYWWYSRQLVLS